MNFDAFWQGYTHPQNRGDKVRAKLRFERIIKACQIGELIDALAAYRQYQLVNRWYQPQQLSTWLGSEGNERWREFMTESKPEKWQTALSPLLKESELMAKALEIRQDQERMLARWERGGSVGKAPTVRDLDDITASLRGSEGI